MKRTILVLGVLAVPVIASADPATEYCRRRAAESFSFGQQVFDDCMVRVAKKMQKPKQKAAPLLISPNAAENIVVETLYGEPYGSTRGEIANSIKSQILIIKGNDPCQNSPAREPTWAFRVEAIDVNSRDTSGQPSKINGFLTLNAVSGKINCAGLPYLR